MKQPPKRFIEKWKLIDQRTGKKIKIGDEVMTFRDEPCTVIGFFYPHNPNSTGKVHVVFATEEKRTYYPGVIGAKYRKAE